MNLEKGWSAGNWQHRSAFILLSFENQSIKDEPYYQCVMVLDRQYLKYYQEKQAV